ncbi:MAG: ATP synthase F1 subunit delta [Syntrophales bacterium]|nr:ATP synthase F1 subunit delta [Syntrophales bacterium]MDY0044285.1 ATP synthase F1 subunit delta [Syntrophales bacterium]
MIQSEIAKRYAKALFQIAKEEDSVETIYGELDRFASMLKENKNLTDFFANPIFDQNDKKAVMEEVLSRIKITGITANFLKLLADKRRIDILLDVENCFREYRDQLLNKVRVNVRTAFPLSADLAEKIKARLEGITRKNIEMAVEEDTTLLGGIVVRVGDTLYDGSIKTQLMSIRELIREEM